MKRVLVFLPYVPWPLDRGTFQRVYHLTKELAQDAEVDLFCLAEDSQGLGHEDAFGFCRRVRFEPFRHPEWGGLLTDRLWHRLPSTVRHWWADEASEALGAFTRDQDYDIVFFCDLVLWPYVEKWFSGHPRLVMDRSRVDWLYQLEAAGFRKRGIAEKVRDFENLHKIKKLERRVRERLALTIVCGVDDRTFLEEKLGPTDQLEVLPNGANTGYFDADKLPPDPTPFPSAVFCGALDYLPNTDGLAWYFREIHPRVMAARKDYKIFLVGKQPAAEVHAYGEREGVEFVGEVPDVRPYYRKAWLQVVPLRIGGGTRLKIVEGLAMANPVVSTSLGAQGLDLRDRADFRSADTAEAFAKAILDYIEHPHDRLAEGRHGRDTVIKNYTWEAIGRRLRNRLGLLFESHPS